MAGARGLAGLALLALAGSAAAVYRGDEGFARAPGYVWVFSDGGNQTLGERGPSVEVVDPEALAVVASFDVDPATQWADPVYMEHCHGDHAQMMMAADRGADRAYILNVGAVHAGDAAAAVVATVPLGARPVHSYALPERGEWWAHADDDGHFDVIDIMADVTELARGPVVAHVEVPGHGKLLAEPGMPVAYASNTREPFVYEIDLESGALTGLFNFSSYNDSPEHELHCPGTHGLAFSKANNHVYATCSSVGLAELDVGPGFRPVTVHRQATGGQVYTTPDEKYIVVLDKAGDGIHVLTPGAPGEASSKDFPTVSGGGGEPDKPAFFELPDGRGWRMFVSLVDNVHALADAAAEGDAGVGYLDLLEVENNPEEAQALTFVPGAGAVARRGPYTYRSIATTGDYVATITHTPTPGVAIIHGATGKLRGVVETNLGASRVRHAPVGVTDLMCEM